MRETNEKSLTDIIGTKVIKKYFNSAVLLAAGVGSRFSQNEKKQFVRINDIPVIAITAKVFNDCEEIDEIVVVTSQNDVEACKNILSQYNITKLTKVVAGGDTRQDSSRIGFENINPKANFVAIHDAARCCITKQNIKDVFYQAYITGSAIAAERAVDTVKRCDKKGNISETIDRNEIWLAKTPQVFKSEIYRASAYLAIKNKLKVTDDASMAEACGFAVKLVDCGNENIKITYPEDRIKAEAILKSRIHRTENIEL